MNELRWDILIYAHIGTGKVTSGSHRANPRGGRVTEVRQASGAGCNGTSVERLLHERNSIGEFHRIAGRVLLRMA